MTTKEIAPLPTAAPTLNTPAKPWFEWAVGRPVESHIVQVTGCPIHYLLWPEERADALGRGLLFLHGGGAHANWWRFIAPFFTQRYRVAAYDLSGMGDSGARDAYSATIRADEIEAVLDAAGFFDAGRPAPVLIGHSFGGLTAMRYVSMNSARLGGFIIAESPIRRPADEKAHFETRSDAEATMRIYESYRAGVDRFRLRPRQTCLNDFVVEFIARHSLRAVDGGWSWKFDPPALTRDRHNEPFREYLSEVTCRTAFIYGERSALCTSEVLAFTRELLGPRTPFIGIPEGQHHLTLDQPLAFVAAVRSVLQGWRAGVS